MGIGTKYGITASTGNNIQTDGLVAYWDAAYKKSYTTGSLPPSTFNLASGSLTPTGSLKNDTTFTTQPISASCWVFDGVDDYIILESNSSLYPGTGDMSYSLWIKPDSITGTHKVIFGPPTLGTGNKAVDIRRLTDTIKVYVGVGVGGTWGLEFNSTSVLSVGVWYHIALTLDRDGNGVIYVNGSADATSAMNPLYSGTDITAAANLQIGGAADGDFEGQIASLQIYNRVLSLGDVLQNYNAQKDRFGY